MIPDAIRRYMRELTREQVGRMALTVLAVLSLGIAAATLGTTTGPGDTGADRNQPTEQLDERNDTGISWLFLDIFGERDPPRQPENNTPAAAAGDGDVPTDALGLLGSGALLVGLALLVAVAMIAIIRATSGEPGKITTEADAESADVAAVGRAAGRAADRLTVSASLNEVYRAWREMTDHLDVSNPQASTPGEFATAAVDAGMAREDVNELTTLFERVRYGGRSVTVDDEESAVEVLRRIERTYTDTSTNSADRDEQQEGDT